MLFRGVGFVVDEPFSGSSYGYWFSVWWEEEETSALVVVRNWRDLCSSEFVPERGCFMPSCTHRASSSWAAIGLRVTRVAGVTSE